MKKIKEFLNNNWDCILAFIVGILCVTTMAVIVIDIKRSNHEANKTHEEIIPLYSISTEEQYSGAYHGSFIYGVAHINSKEYIVTYRILDDGGKQYYKINREDTIIYDTLEPDEQAYVKVEINNIGETISTKLYVPKDTIAKEINLEL